MMFGLVIATIASFVASAILYGLPPVSRLISTSSTPRPGIPVPLQMATVALRSLFASLLVTGLMVAGEWNGPSAGALLGLSLSVLPAILLFGAVIHEGARIPVVAVHLLDWIVKLVVIGVTVGLFL